MNYKVLYRKYRPDSFNSLIGQEHVVTILKNSIIEDKIAHAYLFSGPRGTGKTSTARILAKAINCLDNKKGIACEVCENCQSFNSNPDIIEIDAASNNGVKEIRELINNVKIMPTSLKYKVYIIDEVHMLSESAFNALLLTLEEPPQHVIFILATTNLESVPITILSRCQRFDFKRIADKNIFNRLEEICQKENIEYEEDGLKEIATLSDGGLRDALSILDQLSKNNELITTDLVAKEIGTISSQKILDLVKCLDDENIDGIEQIFLDLQNTNLNYKVFIKKLVYVLSDIGAEILKGTNKWKLDFDTCKNLILELNNLLNKISINVEPYLLIKITFWGFLKSAIKPADRTESEGKSENKNTKNEVINKIDVKKEEKVEKKSEEVIEKIEVQPKNNSNLILSERLIDIRINNCFVEASKNYLLEIKPFWDNFMNEVESSLIKGLISDTMMVTASDKYAIVVTTIPHKDEEINEKLSEIEDLFNSFVKQEKKLVFIDEERWQKEKTQYINNLKNKKKYEYIAEDNSKVENNDCDLTSFASVFDIDKIEVE